ncbi:L-cystine transporter [Aciduricibacillus chroicocephali]|uniref:L-cystine uptake protein TcyP n=1 Tax=Aciduricibacillus chroicocephali TaxID=3054939 RepID=A0ABY9KUU7_9BACI|nr:L-cystine transporter [Bacillaceae bacterium 44XB]
MNVWFVLINIIVFLLFTAIIVQMQRKHVSFGKRVFTALGLGIVLGAFLQIIYGANSKVVATTTDWYGIAGSGYVKLLMMIVVPLVMVSIIQSIINLEKSNQLGKMAAWIIGILVATAMVAALIGITSAGLFHLNADQIQAGQAENARAVELQGKFNEIKDLTTPQKIVDFIPSNVFQDMTGERPTSVIAIVIFSMFVGIAVLGLRRKNPEQAARFTDIINAIYAVIMRIVTLILRLTPYGILALIATMVATTDVDGVLELGKFVLASYAALITMFVIHLVLLTIFGLNPGIYLKKVLPVLTFAFTSRSSAGTIPLNAKMQKDSLGVDQGIANMSASFGATIGQNGCAAIYPAMLAIMVAPTVGIDPFTFGFIAKLVVIIGISSFGIAGVGGGATFAALIVLSSMGLPIAVAGLLISIEPLIDMGRTALNVNDSILSGTLTSRFMGKMDKKVYQDPDAVQKDLAI